MSVVVRNDYGAIAVNKGVIERMIIEDLLGMSDVLLLSTKKGKQIKEKPTPFIDPDYYDAIEVSEKKGIINVKVYVIMKRGVDITASAAQVFEAIEKDFDLLRLEKPAAIKVKVSGLAGVLKDEIVRRSIDIVRNNA